VNFILLDLQNKEKKEKKRNYECLQVKKTFLHFLLGTLPADLPSSTGSKLSCNEKKIEKKLPPATLKCSNCTPTLVGLGRISGISRLIMLDIGQYPVRHVGYPASGKKNQIRPNPSHPYLPNF